LRSPARLEENNTQKPFSVLSLSLIEIRMRMSENRSNRSKFTPDPNLSKMRRGIKEGEAWVQERR
jgi:hypothetical protein